MAETSFVTVKVSRQPDFENHAGILVEKHFLQFRFGEEIWGFGLSKAQAILSFRQAIEFVAKS